MSNRAEAGPVLSKCISAWLNWSFNWWSSEPPLYTIYTIIILMYWKIGPMILISYYPSQSVWWKKGCLETETWKQEKKNTKLSFARKHGRRRNLGRQGCNTRYVSFRSFLHRPSCISNSVDKTKLPRADRTTTPRKTSIKNMN